MPENEEGSAADLRQTFSHIRHALVRRRWFVCGLACLLWMTALGVLMYLPNRYTSEAIIFAVQQRVPERYVVPTATSDVSQALEAMVQEVLSRPRLLSIIMELGLYSQQKGQPEPEKLIQKMRRDVTVHPIQRKLGRGEVNAFRVAFVAEDPKLAQAVTQRLTTLFIEQNLKTRADQSSSTTRFLREQLAAAKSELENQERRLRDFKMQFLGELPEQQQGNIGILAGLQSQLESVMTARNHAQQQRLYLESLLTEYERRAKLPVVRAPVTNDQAMTPLQKAERELLRLESDRKLLLAIYRPNHPDVLRKEAEIKAQQAQINSMRLIGAEALSSTAPEVSDTNDPMLVAQFRSQLQANALELENLASKEQTLRAEVDRYQARLNLTPVREQQLAAMQRDYDFVRQHYGELLKKEQESQLATDLEKRQEGQQFRLADPPNLPSIPSSPKRLKLSLIALAAGLILAALVAIWREMRNPVVHLDLGPKDKFGAPLLVSIPLFLTTEQKRLRRWKAALECVAASLVLAAVAVVQLHVYRHG
jgi:polysaccharide biosynthesis transport protein